MKINTASVTVSRAHLLTDYEAEKSVRAPQDVCDEELLYFNFFLFLLVNFRFTKSTNDNLLLEYRFVCRKTNRSNVCNTCYQKEKENREKYKKIISNFEMENSPNHRS